MNALDRSGGRIVHYGGVFGPDDLARLRTESASAARGAGLDEEDTEDFVLAISEAITNVIEHADGVGAIAVFVDGNQLIADVTDQGPGSPIDVPNDLPGAAQARGRGLWLMRRCVDRMEILSHRIGHRLRLVKIIPSLFVVSSLVLFAIA